MATFKCFVGLVGLAMLVAGNQALGDSVTLNFDGVPQAHWHKSGNTNLGSYYAGEPKGPVFGPDATILESSVYGYNSGGYPASSGDAVLFTDITSYIDVDFSLGPVSAVSVYYVSGSSLFMDAFDAGGSVIASVSGTSNYGGSPPGNLTIDQGSETIHSVRIHDAGNFYVIDDFTYKYDTALIPTPTVAVSLIGLGVMGSLSYGCRRRKR